MTCSVRSFLILCLGWVACWTAGAREDEEHALSTRLTELPVLYKADEGLVRRVKLNVRGQYQEAAVSPNGANRFRPGSGGHNAEWRRAYLGGEIRFADGWRIWNLTNVGGLEGKRAASHGAWVHRHTDWSLYELYVEKKWTKGRVNLGKLTPHYTPEYCLSSSAIKTVERSAMVNQVITVSNWGLWGAYEPSREEEYAAGVYLSDTNRDLSREVAWSDEGRVFTLLSVKRRLAARGGFRQTLSGQYVHNFARFRGRAVPADSDYAGPCMQDTVSLGWEASCANWSFMGNLIGGWGLEGRAKGKQAYGLIGMVSNRFAPHWEAVLRFQCSLGRDAVKADTRYITSVTEYPAWVDRLQAVYLGLNYYVFPAVPDMMKLMLGVEYTATSAHGAQGFDGWTIMGAARFRF